MVTMTEPRTYTIEQAAKVLQVNQRTVNRLLERGELRGVKVGRLWRIPEEALNAYLRGERPEENR